MWILLMTHPSSSHVSCCCRLMRKVGNESFLIPDEKPPLNREGQEWWPAGWSRERRIDRQQDLFELLDIPYREPGNRQCPG